MEESLVLSVIKNTLETNLEVSLVVRGRSMEPLLKEGDRVTIRKKDPTKLRIGDLVAFEKAGNIYTHRLIKKTDKDFLTKGDNNFYPDFPIKSDDIFGKVISIERRKRLYIIKESCVSNTFLGYCHLIISMFVNVMLRSSVLNHGKLKRILYWIGRSMVFPIKVLERMLIHAI